jgi:hypothetical protein
MGKAERSKEVSIALNSRKSTIYRNGEKWEGNWLLRMLCESIENGSSEELLSFKY